MNNYQCKKGKTRNKQAMQQTSKISAKHEPKKQTNKPNEHEHWICSESSFEIHMCAVQILSWTECVVQI